MKILKTMLLLVLIVITMTACSSGSTATTSDSSGEESSQEESSDDNVNIGKDAKKTLVAYFALSRNSEVDAESSASVTTVDGKTDGIIQFVSDWIKDDTKADSFSIETDIKYSGNGEEVIDQAQKEQDDNIRPKLTTEIKDFDDYDVVFIGYPIWWYDMPQEMYSFFDKYDFGGKTIIPFSTHNGSGFTGTIEKIQELEPKAKVITNGLTLSQDDVKSSKKEVDSWVKGFGY